jgi:4-hydroxy-3-polyprenylbenzoate decarboxylase
MRLIVALTGASGAPYGLRLLEVLWEKGIETHCIVSEAAKKLIAHEVGDVDLSSLAQRLYDEAALEAPPASGSTLFQGMAIVPCSMKTLAAVANGLSSNLIARCADVMIKEGRKLVLVPRETPLSPIHLENMLKLSRADVTILPAMPAFYHKPKDLAAMVDFIVGKVLDSLGVENDLYARWQGR